MENTLIQNFAITYSYPIVFTEKLFQLTNTELKDFLYEHRNLYFKQKVLLVVDDAVWKTHPYLSHDIQTYFDAIDCVQLAKAPLIIAGGERCKNDTQVLDSIIKVIDDYGIDRHSYVIGLGGGAVLDLVGFAAAVSHRGIRHIRIPTTVLSQNDSGVGVKNSVNYKGKKNFLGTFAPPVAVFNDFSLLSSLDSRSWVAGISEAIKVALIKDLPFFNWICDHAVSLRQHDSIHMKELIFRCADLHLEHIRNGDPFEYGSSRPLDFGHWSAHKLEQLTDFSLLHGEAVAIGLAIDVLYSHFIGNIKEEEAFLVINLMQELGLPIYHEILSSADNLDKLLAGLIEFQEHLGGRLTVVLLEEMGRGKDYHEIDPALVRRAIDFLKKYQQIPNLIHENS
ncbi:3-dehydroquinate synthase [Sphingobacterium rhinopitheci]|uniref:3-dehydroquinate synthase n=1 Tax=Sphingobacterium rhinopitheci TaxID=2781960 RepID=UPI001F521727|nr:3-dehydroquinate synthase [Sphingobacterium rhinopitheci]MCI0920910.1 3-dehydroquinate synthase [Sphingobacterium rhinopitheci]